MATSRLSTRRVEWRVQVGTSNKAAQGLVIFEASVSYIPDPLAVGGPRTAIPEPVAAVLDSGGYACTPDPSNPAKPGERGAELFTTDSLGEDGGDWTWTARPQLRSVNGIQMADAVPAFSFAVPAGAGSLDLAEVQKVPASPGLGTEQALALVLRAERAAQTAMTAVEETVGEAATDAVNAVIRGKNLVEGTATEVDNLSFSFTDSEGRRSWVEVNEGGGPSAHALALLEPGIKNIVLPEIEGSPRVLADVPDGSELLFAVTDSAGRRSWIEAAGDGGPTQHSASLLRKALALADPSGLSAAYLETSGTSPNRKVWLNENGARKLVFGSLDAHEPRFSNDGESIFFTTTAGERFRPRALNKSSAPLLPEVTIVGTGDSLTAAGIYLTKLGTVLGVPVLNMGMAGWGSADIAIRQGGLQPKLTLSGNMIPASGSVLVTARDPADGYRTGHTGSGSLYAWNGTLAGVPGRLEHDHVAGTWSFSRSTAGTAVSCPSGTRFICMDGADNRDKIHIIFSGRNNVKADQVVRDEQSMVEWLTPYIKQFLVVSVINGQNETKGTAGHAAVLEVNAAKSAAFPNNYHDLRSEFITRGMAIAGISPTPADNAAVAADAPPPSLMADNVHPNTAGYNVIGDLIAAQITSKGWTA